MSKAAQRKQSAYANGYRVGRLGWPPEVKVFRVGSVQADAAWRRGVRDGRRDRHAANRLAESWPRRMLSWLRKAVRL